MMGETGGGESLALSQTLGMCSQEGLRLFMEATERPCCILFHITFDLGLQSHLFAHVQVR